MSLEDFPPAIGTCWLYDCFREADKVVSPQRVKISPKFTCGLYLEKGKQLSIGLSTLPFSIPRSESKESSGTLLTEEWHLHLECSG